MDSYTVLLSPKALRDLEGIYAYVADTLGVPGTAEGLISALEQGILSLETLPYRCPERRIGTYANRGYRQLLVKGFTVIYRIVEASKEVLVVTVVYSRSVS